MDYCIHCQSPLFHPAPLHLKHKGPKRTEMLWLQRHHQVPILLKPKHSAQALSSTSVILGFSSSPSASGDLSVLIGISAPLLLFYWIANFVVPNIISKNANEEQVTTASKNPIEDQ